MNKIERTPAPQWLEKKWEEWGKRWAQRYAKTQLGSSFTWYTNQKKSRPELVEKLAAMTKNHCSFCDAFPMGRRIPYTIEHFRPKTKFPLLAYKWNNLFLCCGLCQQKGDAFDEQLLKPDEDEYHFDHYFVINWDSGELMPNEGQSADNQMRAQITIQLYRLNANGKPEDRLEELNRWLDSAKPNIDEWAYRFFIERGV
ncbi:hypothetical protein QUF90_13245 [Desulfococcaceae bacterium HSG9]|nr:hypothetical protein [Desulfococcaceae bacterium HSG9]